MSDVPPTAAELANRLRVGDDAAATELFHRYVERLRALARSRLSARLAARVDPDDVVMSAYRSFFVRARRGQFQIEQSGDLWRLLVEITLHKLYRQATHHLAQRRSVRSEQSGSDVATEAARSREPTPDEAAALSEELEAVLERLSPQGRRVLELRLQGEELAEIARVVGCSERTVRRNLETARRIIVARQSFGAVAQPAAERRATPPPSRRRFPEGRAADDTKSLSFDEYLLQQQVGIGSSGKVYRAIHRPTQTTVAVKYLKKAFLRQRGAVERFVREAQTVLNLRHPGIVAAQGMGRTPPGGYFLVFDWCGGGDLAARIAAGPVAIADAMQWFRDAAEALRFAHAHGVIHCDLKPSNLLLDNDGRVRVTDFGLAQRIDEGDSETLAGTPAYMAPEQVDSYWGPISPRTDVYGLGTVLYSLFTGRPPFAGTTAVDVLAEIVSGRPVRPPRELRPALPPEYESLCLRCLAKHPTDRFGDMDEILAWIASWK